MILVVADTSPLNYLAQVGCEELLPALYDHVLVPRAVIEELTLEFRRECRGAKASRRSPYGAA